MHKKEETGLAADAGSSLREGSATYTVEDSIAGPLWYIALSDRQPPPYRNQRHVMAILDIDADGNLAGVELIDSMPGAPK